MNNPGFPRPVLPKDGRNTPMPWVGGNNPEHQNWAGIDSNRAVDSENAQLCIVCGLTLSDDYVFMLFNGREWSDRTPIRFLDEFQLPSPTWVHPKCGKIAALYCPHLKRQKYPAMTQDEQRLTHAELTDLAKHSDKPQ